jgi:hypothetical protein
VRNTPPPKDFPEKFFEKFRKVFRKVLRLTPLFSCPSRLKTGFPEIFFEKRIFVQYFTLVRATNTCHDKHMRIFGYQLPKSVRYVHVDYADDFPEEIPINPEKNHSSACHLYEDSNGIQYVGFELSLGMTEDCMRELLCKKGQKYKIT